MNAPLVEPRWYSEEDVLGIVRPLADAVVNLTNAVAIRKQSPFRHPFPNPSLNSVAESVRGSIEAIERHIDDMVEDAELRLRVLLETDKGRLELAQAVLDLYAYGKADLLSNPGRNHSLDAIVDRIASDAIFALTNSVSSSDHGFITYEDEIPF